MLLLHARRCVSAWNIYERQYEYTTRWKKRDSPFSKYCSRHLKPVDLPLFDSSCSRNVDIAMSLEQTTIEGLPSFRVMERENEGKAEKGRASYTISYRPASICLLISRRVSISRLYFLSRGSHFSVLLPTMRIILGKFLPWTELWIYSSFICSRPPLKRHLDNFFFFFVFPLIRNILLSSFYIVIVYFCRFIVQSR